MLDRMPPEDRLWFAIIGTLAVFLSLGTAAMGWMILHGVIW